MKTNLQAAKKAKAEFVITSGEILPDGTVIELVSGPAGSDRPNLLLWDGATARISSRVKYNDRYYEAAAIPPNIYRATRLPARIDDHRSVRDLLKRLEGLFAERVHFAERESRLLAVFSISTWVTDRLPTAPRLIISGPDEQSGIELLKLLGCVCRRPLVLAEITPAGFLSLPTKLSLTLLINQAALRPPMLRLLSASRRPPLRGWWTSTPA